VTVVTVTLAIASHNMNQRGSRLAHPFMRPRSITRFNIAPTKNKSLTVRHDSDAQAQPWGRLLTKFPGISTLYF